MKKHILAFALLFEISAVLLAQSARQNGQDNVVFFVVSQYDDSTQWSALPDAEKECLAMDNVLTDQYGFLDDYHENPDKKTIIQVLTQLKQKKYGEFDQLLLYFSMHGYSYVKADRSRIGILAPKDAQKGQPGSYIDYPTLLKMVDEINCPHILIVIDACYANLINKEIATRSPDNQPGGPVFGESITCMEEINKSFKNGKSREFMVSGHDQVPATSEFSKIFLDILKNKNSSGILRIDKIFSEIKDQQKNNIPLQGQFIKTDKAGYFIFVKKGTCLQSPVGGMPGAKNFQKIPGSTFSLKPPIRPQTVEAFYLGVYEVTVGAFKQFIESTGYVTDAEKQKKGKVLIGEELQEKVGICWRHNAYGQLWKPDEYQHPVANVSYNDALEYCRWYSVENGLNARLPTLMEWELAARNGEGAAPQFAPADSTDISSYANIYTGQSQFQHSAPVGRYKSNDLGLYDLCGNVWEWATASNGEPVILGGSWRTEPQDVFNARHREDRDAFAYNIGFRMAISNK